MDAALRRHLDALFVLLAADVGATLAAATGRLIWGPVVAGLFALAVYAVRVDPTLFGLLVPGE
jgi:hypothetical protein